jgi:hypothetical protein
MNDTDLKTRMSIMETKLNDIDEKLDTHISDQKEHDTKVDNRFDKIQKTMDDFIQRADITYAPYSLMTLAKGIGAGAVVLIIYYVLNHVGLPTL